MVLRNEGETAADFKLFRGTETTPFQTTSLEPKTTQSIALTVSAEVKVKVVSGSATLAEKVLAPSTDCYKPLASVTQVCDEENQGWSVVLDNQGQTAQEFVIKTGSTVLKTQTVAAGKQLTVSGSFASSSIKAGSSIPLEIYVGGKLIASKSVINDCVKFVAPELASDCAEDGIKLTLHNGAESKVAETYEVTVDGEAIEGSPFVVEPGKSVTQIVEVDEDTSVTFNVKGLLAGFNQTVPVNRDCVEVQDTVVTPVTQPEDEEEVDDPAPTSDDDTEVLDEEIENPDVDDELAETGLSVSPLTGIATVLVLLGIGCWGLSRRLQNN